VLCAMHEIWPEAPVFTSIYDRSKIKNEKLKMKNWGIRSSCLDSFPPARWLTKYFTFLVPLAFEQFDLSKFDVVISSSANFAKGVITQPYQLHICYCHTPPRFLYHYPTETNRRQHWFWGPILKPLDNYLRIWDYCVAQRVDFFIANSKNVAARIKKFYHKDAKVIYPPVDIRMSPNKNSPNESEFIRTKNLEYSNSDGLGYYLVVSRLSKYKNVNLAIEASNRLKFPLKIVGVGREEKNLRKIAGPTVEFLGAVSDEELARLYTNCQAVIFSTQDEDFGIVPVEAMSFGKQVIALRSGGVLESVIEGKAGVFFEKPVVESLVEVLRRFDTRRSLGRRRSIALATEREGGYQSSDCRKQAEKFSKERFQREIREFVENRWQDFQLKRV